MINPENKFGSRSANAIQHSPELPDRAASMFGHDQSLPSLIFFCHPHCPQLASTVRQLEMLRGMTQSRVNWRSLVYWPESLELAWATTDPVQRLGKIPSLAVTLDRDGKLTREFGVRTSGHVLYYDEEKRLGFSGGILDSQRGAVESLEPIQNVIQRSHRLSSIETSPIFGCPIFDSHQPQG